MEAETLPLPTNGGGTNPFLEPCRWNLAQFGLMCTYTMGVTAIWKFPFYVYKHTGLFLVAYYTLLILVCIPVAFIQLKLGAILRRGVIGIYTHYFPAFKGVAWGMLVIAFLQCVYHAVYLSFNMYYMIASIQNPYPWSANISTQRTSSANYIYFAQTSAEHYYKNEVLQVTESISQPGGLQWKLALCLIATWFITWLMICRGPGWFGKVVYGSAPVTICLMFAILIYSHLSIPEAHRSLWHFFSNERPPPIASNGIADESRQDDSILKSELASPLTWIRALEQHIYSIGLWTGLLPTLGAFLGNKKPAGNLTWLIVLLVHSMLPHLGTIAMAPFIHALALHRKTSFEDIITSGPSLLFVVLPEAFQIAKINHVWPVLFYLCFFLFAQHQQALLLIAMLENAIEAWPEKIKIVFRRREFLAAALCGFGAVLGLPHCLQSGVYLTELVDVYLYRLLFILVVVSIVPIILAYGTLEAFHLPIERLGLCIWFSLASLATAGLLVYNLLIFVMPYTTHKEWPLWSDIFGWMTSLVPILVCLIGGFVHAVYMAEGTPGQKLISVMKPGPRELVAQNPDEVDPDEALEYLEGGGTLKLRKKASKKKDPKCPPLTKSATGDSAKLLEADEAGPSGSTPGTPKTPKINQQNRMLFDELQLTLDQKKEKPAVKKRTPSLTSPESITEESVQARPPPQFLAELHNKFKADRANPDSVSPKSPVLKSAPPIPLRKKSTDSIVSGGSNKGRSNASSPLTPTGKPLIATKPQLSPATKPRLPAKPPKVVTEVKQQEMVDQEGYEVPIKSNTPSPASSLKRNATRPLGGMADQEGYEVPVKSNTPSPASTLRRSHERLFDNITDQEGYEVPVRSNTPSPVSSLKRNAKRPVGGTADQEGYEVPVRSNTPSPASSLKRNAKRPTEATADQKRYEVPVKSKTPSPATSLERNIMPPVKGTADQEGYEVPVPSNTPSPVTSLKRNAEIPAAAVALSLNSNNRENQYEDDGLYEDVADPALANTRSPEMEVVVDFEEEMADVVLYPDDNGKFTHHHDDVDIEQEYMENADAVDDSESLRVAAANNELHCNDEGAETDEGDTEQLVDENLHVVDGSLVEEPEENGDKSYNLDEFPNYDRADPQYLDRIPETNGHDDDDDIYEPVSPDHCRAGSAAGLPAGSAVPENPGQRDEVSSGENSVSESEDDKRASLYNPADAQQMAALQQAMQTNGVHSGMLDGRECAPLKGKSIPNGLVAHPAGDLESKVQTEVFIPPPSTGEVAQV